MTLARISPPGSLGTTQGVSAASVERSTRDGTEPLEIPGVRGPGSLTGPKGAYPLRGVAETTEEGDKLAAKTTEAWLMALEKNLSEVEQDTEEAFEKGRAKVDITYRF
jgi:hypothetical protein